MDDKNKNPALVTPETMHEPGTNFDGILNNAPTVPPVPVPEVKPLDKVRELPRKKRSRELER